VCVWCVCVQVCVYKLYCLRLLELYNSRLAKSRHDANPTTNNTQHTHTHTQHTHTQHTHTQMEVITAV